MNRKEFQKEMAKVLPLKDRVPQWAQYLFGFIFIASIGVGLSYGLTWINICFGPWCVNAFALAIGIIVTVLVTYYIKLVINNRKLKRRE